MDLYYALWLVSVQPLADPGIWSVSESSPFLCLARSFIQPGIISSTPQGQVPVLRFDDGRLLTENSAVLQALARKASTEGAPGLLPEAGTRAHDETLEWLSFIGTEIHKQCLYPMFQRDAPGEVKAWSRSRLPGKLRTVASRLEGRRFRRAIGSPWPMPTWRGRSCL